MFEKLLEKKKANLAQAEEGGGEERGADGVDRGPSGCLLPCPGAESIILPGWMSQAKERDV